MTDTQQTNSAFRKRRWHHRRDARFMMFVAVLLIAFYGYGFATGPQRISENLQTALDQGAERVNIIVTSKFPPESFHLNVYQDVGSMRGSEGSSTILHRVKARDIGALSRYYWIKKIDLAPEKKGS